MCLEFSFAAETTPVLALSYALHYIHTRKRRSHCVLNVWPCFPFACHWIVRQYATVTVPTCGCKCATIRNVYTRPLHSGSCVRMMLCHVQHADAFFATPLYKRCLWNVFTDNNHTASDQENTHVQHYKHTCTALQTRRPCTISHIEQCGVVLPALL